VQAALDNLGQFAPAVVTLQTRSVGDVVEYRARKRYRGGEDEPDPAAQCVDVEPTNLMTVQQDVAGAAETGLVLDQPVDSTQERGLARVRGPITDVMAPVSTTSDTSLSTGWPVKSTDRLRIVSLSAI
jgi:hypothetical protein